MIKNKLLLFAVMALLILVMALPASAEEKEKDKNFSGSFLIGYRGVDVAGVQEKYKEDYNLHSGPTLFSFKLHYLATGALKKYVDRIDLSVHDYGGEPFETIHISAVKYGTYQFKYDRRKSNYFYKDNFAGGDFHTFDFDRINDSIFFKLWLTKFSRFYFNVDVYTKKGNSTTSLDINRDEFEFDKPIHESSKEVAFGIDFSLKGMTLLLEERIRDYENDYHFFLAGPGMGEDYMDPAELMYFNFNQPYDFRSNSHIGRLSWNPFKGFLLKAGARISKQDMRMDYSETAAGTTYFGAPFSYSHTGDGDFERKLQLYDVDITYLVSNNVALMASARYRSFEQTSDMDVYDEAFHNEFDYNSMAFEGGLQYQASGDLSLSAGFRTETREVDMEEQGMSHITETKNTGFFGNIKYNLGKSIKLTGDYQMGSIEDPFTDISPSDFNRLRFTAKYTGKNHWLTGSYMWQNSKNDIGDGWDSERTQINVRAGFKNKTFKLSLGYGLIYSEQEGDRHFVFYGTPATWNILYEGRTNMFDAYLYFFAQKNWTLGGYANWYKTDGSWDVERIILRPFLEVKLDGGFIGQLAYRYIDFKENVEGLNNYTANIFEISFGYRW